MRFRINKSQHQAGGTEIEGESPEAAAAEYVRANNMEGGTYFLRELPDEIKVNVTKEVNVTAEVAES